MEHLLQQHECNKKFWISINFLANSSAPLVPVFSFGETDVFRPFNNPEDGFLRRFQEKVRQLTGISPMFPIGRGMFQYSYGVVPLRSPVTTVGEYIYIFLGKKEENELYGYMDILQSQKYDEYSNPNCFFQILALLRRFHSSIILNSLRINIFTKISPFLFLTPVQGATFP